MAAGSTTRLEFRGQETTGISRVTGGNANDLLQGGYGIDELHGAGGNDVLAGYFVGQGAGDADYLFGDAGEDTLHLGRYDEGEGGADDDTFILQGSFSPALIDGGDGVDTVRLTRYNSLNSGFGSSPTTLRNVERLEADGDSGGSLTAAQLGSFATIAPLAGQTTASLRLNGGGAAEINPEADLATLTIAGSTEADLLTMAAGSMTRFIYRGQLGASAVDADGIVRGGSGDDLLEGGEGEDSLEGGAGNDVLAGSTITTVGNDVDHLYGGLGEDTLHVARGDYAYGGADYDTFLIQGSVSPALLDGGQGNDVVRLDHPGASIAEAELFDLERLEVTSLSSGGRVATSQLGQFAVLAPLTGSTIADLTLASGGTARDIATDPLLLTL